MLAAALAAPPVGGPAGLRPPSEPDTAPIADAVTAYQHHASTRLEELQAEGHRGAAEIKADRKALTQRAKSHQRDTEDMTKATKRHTLAVAKAAADLHALPPAVQAMLPYNVMEVSADDAAAAAVVVATRQTEVQGLFDQRDKARAATTEVLASQRALDQEARVLVERPLSDLHGSLDAWAQAAVQALEHLDLADRAEIPTTRAEPGIAELRQYATALASIASATGGKLTDRAITAAHRADAAVGKLGEHAAALTDVDGFDPEADLTSSQALHPLVAAVARAESEAKGHRQKQQEAHDLIKPAADLDFAIAAGRARYEALEVLRRELVDAKFLGHLTTLRTRALLGVASELLGQMSDGRFGFADGFDIVSRSSGVIHPPNRLSGGEKFLASLALALALAELHSRSGPTLGSLFLDEGFAALDTTILESALEVLRTQAGGERLVMVISHLHAVAEAVDDVLLVKRTLAGSSAHWLTPQERDDLVHADLASGLQKLTQ
jgi:exonuclease SbcC